MCGYEERPGLLPLVIKSDLVVLGHESISPSLMWCWTSAVQGTQKPVKLYYKT